MPTSITTTTPNGINQKQLLQPTFRTLNSDREKLRGEKIQVSIKTNILRKKGV